MSTYFVIKNKINGFELKREKRCQKKGSHKRLPLDIIRRTADYILVGCTPAEPVPLSPADTK
jgi:hypothetical protein